MIATCGSQWRVAGFGKPFALDFGAIMAVATAQHADVTLLAELLPSIQSAAVAAVQSGEE